MEGSASVEADSTSAAGRLDYNLQTPSDRAGTAANVVSSSASNHDSASPGVPEQRRRCMSDKFMLYTYKIKLCKRQDPHNWRLCPYAHPGEAGRRRPPHMYQAVMCDFNKTKKECSHGERCLLARNALEYWLHPDKYRTILCGHGEACNRNICFFAHSPEELRAPANSPAMNDLFAGNLAAATGAFQQLAIAPQTAAGIAGNPGQHPQLTHGQNSVLGSACSYFSGGPAHSSAPYIVAQGPQSQTGLPLGAASMSSSHQMMLAVPSMGGYGALQSSLIPSSGVPGYLSSAGPVPGTAGQVLPPGILQQQQQQQMLQVDSEPPWGLEHHGSYQQQTQVMISGAGPSGLGTTSLPLVDVSATPLLTQPPGAVQQQWAMGAAVPYYLIAGSAQPMMIGSGSAQQHSQQQLLYGHSNGDMGVAIQLNGTGSGPSSVGAVSSGHVYGGPSAVTGVMPSAQLSRSSGVAMQVHAPVQQLQQHQLLGQFTGDYASQAASSYNQYMMM